MRVQVLGEKRERERERERESDKERQRERERERERDRDSLRATPGPHPAHLEPPGTFLYRLRNTETRVPSQVCRICQKRSAGVAG